MGILAFIILFSPVENACAAPENGEKSEKKLTLGDVDENPYLMAAGGWTGKIAVYDLNAKNRFFSWKVTADTSKKSRFHLTERSSRPAVRIIRYESGVSRKGVSSRNVKGTRTA